MRGVAVTALKLYKSLVSPMLPAACRYVPTCSEYAAEAIAHHGFFLWSGVSLLAPFALQPLGTRRLRSSTEELS